jgi:Leucine-rich repeat (LRR) protein
MKYQVLVIIALIVLLGGCTALKQQSLENTNSNNAVTPVLEKNRLDLSNQQLKKIPEQTFQQINLEELNVSNNQLTGSIQAEIRYLQNLKVLNASNNLMTGVPAEIGRLPNLQTLDLSNNQLTGLPFELGNLKNLKTLNISGNNYSAHDLSVILEKLPAGVNIIK